MTRGKSCVSPQLPVRTFSVHYREKYGCAVGKIPIDTGRICPNRSRGGCVFCRPASFTPSYLSPEDHVQDQLNKGRKQLLRGRFSKYFVYFQQESCTASPVDELLAMLAAAFDDEHCVGAILSTRPDMIAHDLVARIADFTAESGRECLFELGLQSMHDKSLRLLNRNHSACDFTRSLEIIRQYAWLQVGAHLIFGIPGETLADMLETVRFVSSLNIDAVKLHHLQVVHDTELARWYHNGDVTVFSSEAYLELLLYLLPHFSAHTVVHRLWTTSHPALLIAPRWNVLAAELSKRLASLMEQAGLWQGKLAR